MQRQRKTISDWQQDYAQGRTDPVQATEAALAAASAASPAFISMLSERARFEAEQATQRLKAGQSLGPLDGIPMAWKDLVDVAGTVTTGGSRLFDQPAPVDAPLVAAAQRQGVISLGKTNMTELAFSGLGINPHYGTPEFTPGPGPKRVPGGSSSGSAVAVARGVVPVAMGSDTAGSLRLPAAFNGLVSWRPSCGWVSTEGVMPLARSLDTVGAIGHCLEDCIAATQAMAGQRIKPMPPANPQRMTVILDEATLAEPGLEAAVRDNTLRMAERFERAGARVVPQRIEAVESVLGAIARDGWLGAFEAYTEHKALLDSQPAERFDPRVRNRLLLIKEAAPDRLMRLIWLRQALQQALVSELGGAVLLSPTCARVAPELEPLLANDEAYLATNLAVLRLTMVGSFLDTPAVVLPSGVDAQGQYTSVQLSMPSGQDETLLRWALGLIQAMK
ncbi:MAG: amidase family protein [Saccharospirillum sp.]